MSALLLILWVVVCVGVGPVVLATWRDRRRLRPPPRRAIEGCEATPIAGLREGELARIRGVVAAREPLLTSPIGGRSCVGYRAIIDDVSLDPDLSWTPLVNREVWRSFLVTDETGTAAVLGPLEVLVDPNDGAQNLPLGAYDLLAEDNVRMRDLGGPRRFWFRETLLKVGDPVSVLGYPALEIGPEGRGSFREPPQLFVLHGSAAAPIIVIDDDEPVAS